MKPLTCAFGTPWPCGPCANCLAESARLSREFWNGVLFGDWDRDGYTPAERRAQGKRIKVPA